MAHRLAVRGKKILDLSGAKNINRLALKCGMNPQTVTVYTQDHGDRRVIDTALLMRLLEVGCGFTPEQVLEMKIGDLFTLEEVTEEIWGD